MHMYQMHNHHLSFFLTTDGNLTYKLCVNILYMPKKRKDAELWGLTAVTLGEVLKERLDEVATTTKENRSKIIRDALEAYLEQLPHLEEQRQAQQDRAFPIALYRLVMACRTALDAFDYDGLVPDGFDETLELLDKLRESLEAKVSELRPALTVSVEGAVSGVERACHWLRLKAHGTQWEELVNRWAGVCGMPDVYSGGKRRQTMASR